MTMKWFSNTVLAALLLLATSKVSANEVFFPADCCGYNTSCCDSGCNTGCSYGSFYVDWLYWRGNLDRLDVATIGVLQDDECSVHLQRLRPHSKYRSGVRVGYDYALPCQGWSLGLSYTYLPSKAGRTVNFSRPVEVAFNPNFPIFNAFDDEIELTSLQTQWRSDISWLDIDLSKDICVCNSVIVRPHVGFRSYWIRHRLEVTARGTRPDAQESISSESAHLKDRFYGYGIEGGIWTDWNVGCGLSVIGHFGGSVLCSSHKIHGSTRFSHIYSDVRSDRDCLRDGTATLDALLGLQYGICLCNFPIDFTVAWEDHIIFDANQFSDGGNLVLQGLTLGIGVQF